MLYKRKNSPYWYYDFTISGRRFYGSTRCTGKKEALIFEATAKSECVKSVDQKAQLTLNQAFGTYASEVAERQPSWKTTEYQIRNLLKGLGKDVIMSEIRHHHLAGYAAKRRAKVSDTSVNREIEVARRVWLYAGKKLNADLGQQPDWSDLMYKEPQERIRELSDDEEKALMANIREDILPMVEFTLLSGARLSSVINLKWSDANLKAAEAIFDIKGGGKQTLPLTPRMVAIIANQPKVSIYVFTYVCAKSRANRRKGERYPFTPQGWKKVWYAAIEAAKISDFRFHDLRHTRATRILRKTGNLKIVQKALGHANIATTARYAHVSIEDIRAGMIAAESRTIHVTTDSDEGNKVEKSNV